MSARVVRRRRTFHPQYVRQHFSSASLVVKYEYFIYAYTMRLDFICYFFNSVNRFLAALYLGFYYLLHTRVHSNEG